MTSVPNIFAGQAGPLPLAELDANFAALSSGTAFVSPFNLVGSPGLPVSLDLTDGQAGNTIWSVNVGVNAVGEFEIIDNTAGTTPFKIDTLGHVTFASPTDTANNPAVTINGALISGGSAGDLVINTRNGVGLGVLSSTAPFSQMFVKNTLNNTTSFSEVALSADNTTNNFFMTLSGSNHAGGAIATLGVFGAVPMSINSNGVGGISLGTAGQMGFNGSAAVAKPTITGSRGGNAALASLLTALALYGLIVDSTTA